MTRAGLLRFYLGIYSEVLAAVAVCQTRRCCVPVVGDNQHSRTRTHALFSVLRHGLLCQKMPSNHKTAERKHCRAHRDHFFAPKFEIANYYKKPFPARDFYFTRVEIVQKKKIDQRKKMLCAMIRGSRGMVATSGYSTGDAIHRLAGRLTAFPDKGTLNNTHFFIGERLLNKRQRFNPVLSVPIHHSPPTTHESSHQLIQRR